MLLSENFGRGRFSIAKIIGKMQRVPTQDETATASASTERSSLNTSKAT